MGRFRRALSAMAVASLCLVWLHVVHMLAGHEWFSSYGLIPAAILAGVVHWCLLAPAGVRGLSLTAAGSVLPLFVIVEWLEGELAAGHRLAWPVLADHGWPLLAGVALVLAGAMVMEAQRIVRLIRDL